MPLRKSLLNKFEDGFRRSSSDGGNARSGEPGLNPEARHFQFANSEMNTIPSFDPVWQRNLSDPSWRQHHAVSPSDSGTAHPVDPPQSVEFSHPKFTLTVPTPAMRPDSGASSDVARRELPNRSITDPSSPIHSGPAEFGASDFRMTSAPELSVSSRNSLGLSWNNVLEDEDVETTEFGHAEPLPVTSHNHRRPLLQHQDTEEVVGFRPPPARSPRIDKGFWPPREWSASSASSAQGINPLAQSWDPSVSRRQQPPMPSSSRVVSDPTHLHSWSSPFSSNTTDDAAMAWHDAHRIPSAPSSTATPTAPAPAPALGPSPEKEPWDQPGSWDAQAQPPAPVVAMRRLSGATGPLRGSPWSNPDFYSNAETPSSSSPASPMLPRELPWLQGSHESPDSHSPRGRPGRQQHPLSRDSSPHPPQRRQSSSSLAKSALGAQNLSPRTASPSMPRSLGVNIPQQQQQPQPMQRHGSPAYLEQRYGSPHHNDTMRSMSPQMHHSWTSPDYGDYSQGYSRSQHPHAMIPVFVPSVSPSPYVRGIHSPALSLGASSPARNSPRRLEPRRDTDSPTTKDRCKDFARGLRDHEKISYQSALDYFDATVFSLPERSHFRAFLDMADIAKRDNHIDDARHFFEKASASNPQASQVWLEWAKLEEECGDLGACQLILKQGLAHCPLVEALLIKGVKHEERLGNIVGARNVLSQLIHSEPEKSWRMISEGAMLEARTGRIGVARRFFRYLMQAVPSHGPIFYDAVKLEERSGCLQSALRIAEQGLTLVPRYGPLWFATIRLQEKLDSPLHDLRTTTQRALQVVSRELVWKVWYERAQFEARCGLLGDARVAYANAIRFCPQNLRWKIWLGSARTELSDGHLVTARALLHRAAQEVPRKTRAVVLLERSRLEEFDGQTEQAREILQAGCNEARYEWKIFLEAVLVEYRTGRIGEAIIQGHRALEVHPGTGRLWALLIQLHQTDGETAQIQIFRKALQQVPKSGEVWCEGARARLNPLSSLFDLGIARRFLDFAIQFTPQYGDSFVEYMRLELLQTGCTRGIDDLLRSSVNADPNYGALWCHCKHDFLDDADQVLKSALGLLQKELYELRSLYAQALIRCIRNNPSCAICLPCEVVAQPMIQLARKPGSLCALCRTAIDAQPVVALSCEHCFHETCAKKFAVPQTTAPGGHGEKACPLCAEPWCVVRYYVPQCAAAVPRCLTPQSLHGSPSSPQLVRSASPAHSPSRTPISPRLGRASAPPAPVLPERDEDELGLLLDLGRDLVHLMQPRTAPPAAAGPEDPLEAPGYGPRDFVTGLVQLNRDYCRAMQLPAAVRQKLLFGSDFVVP